MKMIRSLPRIALALAILLILWFVVALFGAKLGLIDKLFAFGTMTAGWGAIMAAVVAAIAVVALIISVTVKPRQGWKSALLALIIPLGVFGGFAGLKSTAESVPFIYDITTNTADAPQFSDAMVKARSDSGSKVNPLLDFGKPLGEYEKWAGNEGVGGKTAAQLIADGYPDLKTLTVQNSAQDVTAAVEGAMKMRGFENTSADQDSGIVEGTDVVFWYGFEDDVVARIRETKGGASVDFRSTSRVGTSDLGVNAQRIADLSKAVEDRLAEDFPKVELLMPDEGSDGAEGTDAGTGASVDADPVE
jgi:hypothetical protein